MKLKKDNVPLILGSNGRKLYGLCAGCFPKKNRWIIEDSEAAYAKMIREYQAEPDPEKKGKLLKDLTFLSEFNEMKCGNRFSAQFSDVDKNQVYRDYNHNQTDLMNYAFEEVPEDSGSYSQEDGLITVLDVLKAMKKTGKKSNKKPASK